MLRSLKDLKRYTVVAEGYAIGQVTDFLFDDEDWVVDSLVVETGSWLSVGKVSISTLAVEPPDWSTKRLSITSTKVEIEDSAPVRMAREVARACPSEEDPHLRSCQAVTGYRVHATDGDIGRLEGLLVDDETWGIQYVIVATGDERLGHQVLIGPQWIKEIAFGDTALDLELTRRAAKQSLAYDPAAELASQLVPGLYDNYGHTGAW